MTTPLEETFQLNAGKTKLLIEISTDLKRLAPQDRYHFMGHLKDQMKDPNDRACTPTMDFTIKVLLKNFNTTEVEMVLETIEPTDDELRAAGILDLVNQLKKMGKI